MQFQIFGTDAQLNTLKRSQAALSDSLKVYGRQNSKAYNPRGNFCSKCTETLLLKSIANLLR